MTTPIVRLTARLLVIDDENHVLLFRYEDAGRGWWATPGGGLEAGETFETAAAREACEELGLVCGPLPPLWRESAEFEARGRLLRQVEQFFLLRVSRDEIPLGDTVREAHLREGILAARWWSGEELAMPVEPVYPEGLADRLRLLV